MSSASFRSRPRRRGASWRADVFVLECGAVLVGHLAALHRWAWPGTQRGVLALFATVYMARAALMARWILTRELATEEVTFVALVWVPSILASFTCGAARRPADAGPTGTQLAAATLLYLGGSFLNTFSELQRKGWKAQPQNKGRCYTRGLFSVSRNVNYFGDVVLFGAWAAATGAWWNAWVPLAMCCSFYFYHIPEKEAYLAKRYAEDWPAYQASTKALIPWVL
mmetsp:Transcript_379/g.873  ORF Transcript_379/g.873 Transcript_379/m.873 type:complete len:225 (-) Transcript_379:136-810(-)